jgi:hypothetical protein
MGEAVTVKSSGGMSLFSKIPWTLLLIAYLLAIHFSGIQMEGVPGYVFIGLGVLVLFAEFFKSGDISSATFLTDIIFSVIALVLATGLLTYMLFGLQQTPSFFHWFGYAIILGDAIISPFNSFRTALRNFGVGG